MKYLLYDPHEIGLETGKSMGAEVFVKCPFHDDTHPSAEFNVMTGRFYCFACGAKSFAHFIARKNGTTCSQEFRELPAKDSDDDDAWKGLANSPLAYDNDYLQSRGVTNSQVTKYDIRSTAWGVVFPLRNENEKIVGMLARKYEGTQKYLVFGEKLPIYPLDKFQNYYGEVVVTEGVFGALAADRAGLQSVSTLSAMVKDSAGIWLNQVSPIVCFDDDDSGYIGAAKVLKLAPLSRVIVQGDEFDEMTPKQWDMAITKPRLVFKRYTNNIQDVASFADNSEKFWQAIGNFGKYLKNKNNSFSKKTTLTNSWMRA